MSKQSNSCLTNAIKSLSNMVKSDLAILDQGLIDIYVDSSPSISVPWGDINTDIEVMDMAIQDGSVLLLASIKGDLGLFYSYSELSQTSNFALFDTSKPSNLSFDDEKSILENFMFFQSFFKKTWTRDLDSQEWTLLKQ